MNKSMKKMNWKIREDIIKKAVTVLPIVFLAVTVMIILRFIWGPERGLFNSDWGDTLLWAEATAVSGKLLSPTFSYACLLPFAGNLIMLPAVAMFGVSMKAQMFGMTCFLLIFAISIFLMMKYTIQMSVGESCFATALLLAVCSSSPKLRELFWGHIIYYSLGCMYLVLILYAYSLVCRSKKIPFIDKLTKKEWLGLAVFCLVQILAAVNGTPVLTLASVPFLGGMVCTLFFDKDGLSITEKKIFKRWILVVLSAVSVVIALKIFGMLSKGLIAEYQDSNSAFSTFDSWVDHVRILFTGWFELFDIKPRDGLSIMSVEGLHFLFWFGFSLLLFVVPVIMVIAYKDIKNHSVKVFLWSGVIMEALLLMAWIVGRINGVFWRLSPLVFVLCAQLVVIGHELLKVPYRRRFGTVIYAVVLYAAVSALSGTSSIPKDIYMTDDYYAAMDHLEENGYTYGFAEYWSALKGTVYTENKVKVRSISVFDDKVAQRDYQSDKIWYQPQEGVARYFLLLTRNEYDNLLEHHAQIIEEAKEIEFFRESYIILYFDQYFLE